VRSLASGAACFSEFARGRLDTDHSAGVGAFEKNSREPLEQPPSDREGHLLVGN
jgi:hypothetical protein